MESNEDGFWLTDEEKNKVEDQLNKISDFQRFSSLLVWIGLVMVIFHIGVDLFFHVL